VEGKVLLAHDAVDLGGTHEDHPRVGHDLVRGVEQVRRAQDVDPGELRRVLPGLGHAGHRGQVVDDVGDDAAEGLAHGRAVGDVDLAISDDDLVAGVDEVLGQVAPNESSTSGDESAHQSPRARW
jgi:hypothetical protein